MHIIVSGIGELGLKTAVSLAQIGHVVTCIDENEKKMNSLQRGIYDEYNEEMKKLLSQNEWNLKFTSEYKKNYMNAGIIFITEETEGLSKHEIEDKVLLYKIQQICDNSQNDCIVVLKSLPSLNVLNLLEKNINNKKNLKIAFNPDSKMCSKSDLKNKIIIAVDSIDVELKLRSIYDEFNKQICVIKKDLLKKCISLR